MDEIAKFISTVGFPIAVTSYLLFRLEGVIKEQTKVLNRLITVLVKMGIDFSETDDDKSKS